MTENEPTEKHPTLTRWQQHRFMLMIGATILISLFLVSAALALYASSGAAQLDLSRPGYVSVRDQANTSTDDFDSFPASGEINEKTLDQFRKQYDKQAKKATGLDSFGGEAMSDQALSLDSPNGQ